MDQGSLQPHEPLAALADPDIRTPSLEGLVAYDQLCLWFDEQLARLNERFAEFKTAKSTGR